MGHLFQRQREAGHVAPPGSLSSLNSHIFPKFLKRLRSMERPRLLDLGRLSGPNIEFFARLGCRVQVEDLVAFLDDVTEAPVADPPKPPPTGPKELAGPGVDRVGGRTPPTPPPGGPRLRLASAADLSAARQSATRSGKRPSRRIVLPPRTFPKRENPAGGGRRDDRIAIGPRGMSGRSGATWKSPLPRALAYPDSSFDAIVAWDLFNYYDPPSVHSIAAETRRILKPGGLLICLFHARQADAPDRLRRYQILDEVHLTSEETSQRRLPRQVYHNRQIEKIFTGLRIVELYFLKCSMREILMEKKTRVEPERKAPPPPSKPKPRFRIE